MTPNNQLVQLVIVNGPSKFDLMLSLFDGNKEPRRTVQFRVRSETGRMEINHEVAVTLVQQEDGSGESWNFQGLTWGQSISHRVRGYYSSKRRTGTFNFID